MIMALMLTELYNYVNMCLKYIFLFENEHGSAYEDFLISEHPEDLQMPGLWRTPEILETMQSLSYEIENGCKAHREWEENQICLDRIHYHSHIIGIKRIIYQTHRDVIENNPNTRFKVIKVPISFALRYKTIKLSPYYINDCTTSEICILLKYFVLFSEKVMIQLAKTLCKYLMNEKKLIQEIKMYRDSFCGVQPTSSIINILTPVFGTEETIAQFKRLVRSCIVFNIIDGCFGIKLYGQSQQMNQSNFLIANQDGFALAFFCDKLELCSKWLINNKDKLDTVFSDNMISSPYSVIIKDPVSVDEHANIADTPEKLLNIISTSKFLTGKNVRELTLELSNIHAKVNMLCLKSVNASITVSCMRFSFEFLTSIPSFIKIRIDISNQFNIESLSAIPKNVVHISCEKIRLEHNMEIPDHVESVHIKFSSCDPDKTLVLSKNCNSVIINGMIGTVIFPSVMKCKTKSGKAFEALCFKFETNGTKKQKIMSLSAAVIYTTINIDKEMEMVIFNNVKVEEGSTIVFNDNCKQLKIVKSNGFFDLRPYIGIEHYFDISSVIKILPEKKSFLNLLSIQLHSFHFTQTVKLSNIYESVELKYISAIEGTEIILNKACKKLEIDECKGIINIQEVEYLESLYINFSGDEKDNIEFIGSIRVNQIHITNIFWGICSITSILTNFKDIQCIEFEDISIFMFLYDQSDIYDSLIRHITSKEENGDSSDLLSRLLAVIDRDSDKFIYEAYDLIINFLLKSLIDKGVMDNISKLELGCCIIDTDNCKLLKKLTNLKTLRIRTKKITNQFFYNLPPNLVLLDITDLADNEAKDIEQYVIKPSTIVQQNKTIKILSVKADFIYNVRCLSAMMPSLEILVVQYSPLATDYYPTQKSRIKIRELFIKSGGLHRAPIEMEMIILFIKKLELYIDFESLEYVE
ncbi:putative LRR containing protein [Trachipleistophora hominis]|uniref:Putative LRR containing protein n=1 Tax=Trachipleistophora hominis TaxID=72359 RepID=L7JQR6_TRAHO|nr:putative LRR containing protein [Trachipleistophora hominis]